MLVVLPFAESQVGDYDLPDTTFGYTEDQLLDMISELDDQARTSYIWSRVWMDIPWPIVYASFFYMILMSCFRHTKFKFVAVLPWLGAIFDYIENLIAAIHFGIYPSFSSYWIRVSSLATQVKWSVLFLAMILMVIGGLYQLFKFIKHKMA